ncbi:putative FAD-linked sulfhydryl oxidase [Tupanvirus soda lake]|uniref:Sulfhydryl oxidase n=2 Tax=Tupanvirus TaxID=2094720 RepID=A0A6N1NX95_9VIRU|nr:putative FAD-linked sulfhydryl oxidase [Tupanvirus soda lake]QKU34832.1 putative FAD-linked sulfhydryl oxidase [Tupanvirus soda lake]
MTSCNIDHTDYKNNGLITKIWGGAGWTFNHAITFGYPLEPSEEQKNKYRNYFTSLGDVLPCRYCRESYQKFITTGNTALTDADLKNRETLTKWFYRVHEAVNAKLEMDYGVTYEDVVEKYESFRARCGKPNKTAKGCVAPLDYKAFSFKKLYYADAPIVPLETVEQFVKLAKLRGLDEKYFSFIELARELDGNFTELKKQESWPDRNKICQKQIRYMRENSISSVEEDGIWKGTPTIDELKLLMFLSSNLNRTELKEATNAIHKSLSKSKNLMY